MFFLYFFILLRFIINGNVCKICLMSFYFFYNVYNMYFSCLLFIYIYICIKMQITLSCAFLSHRELHIIHDVRSHRQLVYDGRVFVRTLPTETVHNSFIDYEVTHLTPASASSANVKTRLMSYSYESFRRKMLDLFLSTKSVKEISQPKMNICPHS